jgi:hypothetical protein
MAARLIWRHIAVNEKIVLKAGNFGDATSPKAPPHALKNSGLGEKFALQFFA